MDLALHALQSALLVWMLVLLLERPAPVVATSEPKVENEKPVLHPAKRLILVSHDGEERADITTHDEQAPLTVKHGGKTYRRGSRRPDGALTYREVAKA